ncbi:hypothetical protein ACSQ67_026118 [Phaseolus vulgaris]
MMARTLMFRECHHSSCYVQESLFFLCPEFKRKQQKESKSSTSTPTSPTSANSDSARRPSVDAGKCLRLWSRVNSSSHRNLLSSPCSISSSMTKGPC